MKYVSDWIGDQYIKWKIGQKIIITSGTGSGKTTFVFEKLLKHAIDNTDKTKRKIVYVCNRKALKEQMMEKYREETVIVDGEKRRISEYFYMVSYQYCECNRSFPEITIDSRKLKDWERRYYGEKFKTVVINPDEVLYYIFDEAHYLISDGSFNNSASFWYNDRLKLEDNISVYMTATPEPLYLFFSNIDKTCRLSIYKSEFDYYEVQKNVLLKSIDENNVYGHLSYKNTLENDLVVHEEQYNYSKILERIVKEYNDVIERFLGYTTIDGEYVVYSNPKIYDNYDTYCFDEYKELFELITQSKDKWVIFVSNKEEGVDLKNKLNNYWIYKQGTLGQSFNYNEEAEFSVFLSADILKNKDKLSERKNKLNKKEVYGGESKEDSNKNEKKDGDIRRKTYNEPMAYREHYNLMEKESFNCKVLIATSVIDCGINIKDETVKNIVITQPNKTVFLQMLGRVRLTEGQRINVYIRSIKTNTITAIMDGIKKNVEKGTRYRISMKQSSYITEAVRMDSKRIKMLSETARNGSDNVFTYNDKHRSYSFDNPDKIDLTKDIIINDAQLLYDLYSYSTYYDKVSAKDKSKIFIIEQLRWLGKEYDIKQWVEYNKVCSPLIELLENANEECMKDITCRDEFKKNLWELILKLPVELWPESMRYDRSRYLDGKIGMAQLKKINMILGYIEIPYRIENVTYRKPSIKTWKIVKVD